MSSITTIFGLVAFTNSLFASCYYCIRSERRLADAKARAKALREDAIELEDDGNDEPGGKEHADSTIAAVQEKIETAATVVYGLVFGVVKKEFMRRLNSFYIHSLVLCSCWP